MATLEWDERLRMVLAEPVEVRAGLPAQMEDVLEPLGRDEGGARALALEERIRRDRRPVRETLEPRPGRADGPRSGYD